MKNFLKILLILIFTILSSSLVIAAEKGKSSWGENSSVFDSGFEGQKPVTDNSFNKALKQLKERSMSNKQKKLQKQVIPFSPSSDAEHLKNFTSEQTSDDGIGNSNTIMIPMLAYNDTGERIQPGYYKLSCRKLSKEEYVLDLSQGNTVVITVKAKQTKQDLEQDTISFCNAEIINANRIRLVFGSIDLNLVGYLYYED